MIIRTLTLFDRFRCAGSACRDTCCIRDKLELDNKTYFEYQRVIAKGDAFGRRMVASISERNVLKIILSPRQTLPEIVSGRLSGKLYFRIKCRSCSARSLPASLRMPTATASPSFAASVTSGAHFATHATGELLALP